MTQELKTTTKPAKAKAAPKAKAAKATKPAPLFYAMLLADCLSGKYGALIQRFYVNAASYHLTKKTVFPRPRLAGEKVLEPKDAVAFIEKHKLTSIPAGSKTGQRLYDEMMVEAVKAAKPAA